MAAFKSVSALKKHIEAQVAKVLMTEVADVMREVQRDAINKEVYNVYPDPPVMYHRRDANGGLADPNNMVTTVSGTTLRFRNITPPNGDYDQFNTTPGLYYRTDYAYDGCERSYVFDLPALIEYGDAGGVGGYTHKHSSRPWGPTFLAPRPFMESTRNELKKNKFHVNALHYGLIRAGFKVK